MIFKNPLILFFIPIVLGLVFWIKTRHKESHFRFPSKVLLTSLPGSWKIRFQKLPYILRLLTLALFCVALAGPWSVLEQTIHKTEGIDIVLAVDCSGSMAAEDFQIGGRRQNRLSVIKEVVKEFIQQRPDDRLGLVTFAARAYTVCPLTTDHNWLIENLERIELGLIDDGTAIGSGIASSVSRLKDSKAKSKIIILLTDGVNNAGKVDPLSAARAAEALGIKIYTIGAGTKGYAPFPVTDFFGRRGYQNVLIDIDENTLKEIAKITNGEYFRATDTESLKKIYQQIDKLEKTKIEQVGYKEYKELFPWVLGLSLMILFLQILLENTLFFKIP